MTTDEIIDRFERNRSFYQTGGITATGGEPMLQLDFLTELFTKAKEKGIHTCLDTSGIMFPKKHTGTDQISERHRHRYEVNNTLLSELEAKGLIVSGRAPGTDLCEMIELPKTTHPWFVGCQFHPEFTSSPRHGHPLFSSFIRAAIASHKAAKAPQ